MYGKVELLVVFDFGGFGYFVGGYCGVFVGVFYYWFVD